MSKTIRILAALAASLALAAGAASTSSAAPGMQVGFFDDAQTLFSDPATSFATFKDLRTQIVRVSLYWGYGPLAVAKKRPANPTNPADPAYDWTAYDRAVQYANANGIKVLFSIWGTPDWANGGKGFRAAPTKPLDLQNFAYAAAKRYSGTFVGGDKRLLPPVRHWLAWNEPNNPAFLSPQYVRKGSQWVVQSAVDYAKICNAVYMGVHLTAFAGEKVGCGVTAPRGNNAPATTRPSVSPGAFLRAVAKADPKLQFDAWAHHPYYGKSTEQPDKEPPRPSNGGIATAVTLGNINALATEVTKLFGASKRLWITEYGYQTNPPDAGFGVPPATQAAYLKTSFALAKANPKIDMMIWFLVRDEENLAGWQSGLIDAAGAKKPAYAAFKALVH